LQNEIRAKYLDSPHRSALDKGAYAVFDRIQENRRALYREANIPRETALAELEQQYQKLVGAMTVRFRGEDYTLAQMSPFLEEPNRELRREAWQLVTVRRLADRDALDGLFEEMLELRVSIASEAGFDSYTDYAYLSRERFDYGPQDVAQFRDAVERFVVPLATQIQEQRRRDLKVETLRPWDLSVDPLGRPPLRPFREAEQLAQGITTIFQEIDPELGAQFAFLHVQRLLDLANRKGKAPGGYQTTLEDDRLPFIFMNAVGVDGDLRTLLHEGGHAFHALAARAEPLAAYREAPIEFCEVASMAMELLGARNTGVFYSPEDAARSYRQLLEGIVLILPWIATVDAFQHAVYARPGQSREQRRQAWTGLLDRFGGIVSWADHEEARASSWHRQLHIFLYPFYYIEYGIAQLGALQVWKQSLEDRAGAIASYRRALAVGGSRSLPELFDLAGTRFSFTAETIRPLMESIRAELARIEP
jgi:oligoendopeptidase F